MKRVDYMQEIKNQFLRYPRVKNHSGCRGGWQQRPLCSIPQPPECCRLQPQFIQEHCGFTIDNGCILSPNIELAPIHPARSC